MSGVSFSLPACEEFKEDAEWMAGAKLVMSLAGGQEVRAVMAQSQKGRSAADLASEGDYDKLDKMVAGFEQRDFKTLIHISNNHKNISFQKSLKAFGAQG